MKEQVVAREVGAGDFIEVEGRRACIHVKGQPVDGHITFKVNGNLLSTGEVTVKETDELTVLSRWPNYPAGFTVTLAKKRSR